MLQSHCGNNTPNSGNGSFQSQINDIWAYIRTKIQKWFYGQGTIAEFVAMGDDFNKDSFIITDPGKEGLFVYDANNNSLHDGITVIVVGNKHFVRKNWGSLTYNYFVPLSYSNDVIENYLKVGNLYYGLYSGYTGQEITATESVTKIDGNPQNPLDNIDDSMIDNITYFKFADGKYGIRNWYAGIVEPEEFGAKANGKKIGGVWNGTDSTTPIQNALNSATNDGLYLKLRKGTYLISNTLKPKIVNNRQDYRLTIKGRGKGVSILQGYGSNLGGKNLFEANELPGNGQGGPANWFDSNILFEDFLILAGPADRCMYLNKVINTEIAKVNFRGGEVECLKVGDGSYDNFATYIHNCYFNTNTMNGGQNQSLINIDSAYAEIHNNVGDGSRIALRCSLNQMVIHGNTFEGFKYAGVYARGAGGGKSKITANTLRPYAHYDPNAIFNGEMHGILIESVSGGVYGSGITTNQIIMPPPAALDTIAAYTNIVGNLKGSPYATENITGATSGAVGRLYGINTATGKVQIAMISGTFTPGETVNQLGNNASFTIGAIVENHTYGVSLLGGDGSNGFNIVDDNGIEGAEWCVNINSPGNRITNNIIAGTKNGIITRRDTVISNNTISLYGAGDHIAVERVGNVDVYFQDNNYTGRIVNIDHQMFTKLPKTEINAITSAKPGLMLYDTTSNEYTFWDGTAWVYQGAASSALLSSKTIGADSNNPGDLNNEIAPGVFTFGTNTAHALAGYGTVLNIMGNTELDPWTSQFVFYTNGFLEYRQRIHTYGDWESQRLWTDKFNKLPALPFTTSAASAIGAGNPPTQAEFNTLVDIVNSMHTYLNQQNANLKSKGLQEY